MYLLGSRKPVTPECWMLLLLCSCIPMTMKRSAVIKFVCVCIAVCPLLGVPFVMTVSSTAFVCFNSSAESCLTSRPVNWFC